MQRRLAAALAPQRAEVIEAWRERIGRSPAGKRIAGRLGEDALRDLLGRTFDGFESALAGPARAFSSEPLLPLKAFLSEEPDCAAVSRWTTALFDICRDALDSDHRIPPRDLLIFRDKLLDVQERLQGALVEHARGLADRDATARFKKSMAESARDLREARERYKTLVERLDEVIFTLDGRGRFDSASGRGLKTLGLTQRDLVGKPINAVIPAPYHDEVRILRAKLLSEKRLRGVTIKTLDARGREVTIALTATLLEEAGKPAGALGIARDVTPVIALQEQLRESRDYFELLVESSVDGIIAGNSEGEITFFSKGAEELFGYPSAEVLNKPVSAFFTLPEGGHEALFRSIAGAQGRLRNRECVCRRRDGEEIAVSYSAGFLHNRAEEAVGFIAVCKDITERRRAEGDIRAKNEELEAYARTVSHDLRGPLVSINGYASLLEEALGSTVTESGRHYLKRIEENARTMGRLISDVLEYSTAGRLKGTPYWIRLGQLLDSLGAELRPQLDKSAIRLEIQRPMPQVLADETRMRQVFSNLITNAIKHLRGVRNGLIEVSAEQGERGHTLCVADNGMGISREDQEHIFDLFFSRGSNGGGRSSGIGLAIVKKTIEAYRGRVWVESEPGKGARFYLQIPETKA
ncbi:MAG: PAS domain S-box protein [Myxococcota bacterium]